MPKVSVLLPAFNAARYLREAVCSIKAQSFADWECIVIDDGSNDGTWKLLEEEASREQRLRIVRKEHQGLVACLNQGLELAKSSYIARMDADDRALPKRLETQIARLDLCDDCVAVGGGVEFIDDDGCLIGDEPLRPLEHSSIVARLLRGMGALAHPTVVFRKDAVQRVGGYRAELFPAEDLDLWLRLTSIGSLANVPDRVLQYRLTHSSISMARRAEQCDAAGRAVADYYQRHHEVPPKDSVIDVPAALTHGDTHQAWAGMALVGGNWNTAAKHAILALRHNRGSIVAFKILVKALLRTRRLALFERQTDRASRDN